jgi:hypothetical protein
MTDIRKLPNFFILGAPKAGTTSLFNILQKHPQVFGSPVKETGFFSKNNRYAKGLDWYEKTFFKEAAQYPIRMEATPTYLTWSEKTAPRMQSEYPVEDLKFALIFRDPVKRAYSHYWHHVRLGNESLTFEDAINQEETRISQNFEELFRNGEGKYGYFRASCYASRLKPFLELFDQNQFIYLLQEDISDADFLKTEQRLKNFLTIDESIALLNEKSNQASLPRKHWLVRMYWNLKRTFLSGLYRKMVNDSVRKEIFSSLFPVASYPPLDEELGQQLRIRFSSEIKELEQIIHRDLSSWYT